MMFLLLFLAFSLFDRLFGQPAAALNAKGNEHYQAKRYDEAQNVYRAAQLKQPESAALHYNIGNTLYRQSRYDDALQQYRQATAGPKPLNAQAHYNAGNTLYRTGKLDEAVEAYKRTLRILPNDADAKFNLEFIKRQMQQRQKPPPQQRQKPPEDRPQQDEQPQPQQPQPEQQKARQPQPVRPGEMTREEAERLLNALNQSEQDVQKQRRKQTPTRPRRSEKDW